MGYTPCTRAAADARSLHASVGRTAIPFDPIEVVVVGLHLRWDGVWQRPNHLLARIARIVPVIVLEEPLLDERDGDEVRAADGLTVIVPHRVAPRDVADDAALGTVRRIVEERLALLWLYTPMMLPLAQTFSTAPLVYDKMDELASFAHADPRLAGREEELLARADMVFAGGRSLFRGIEHRARKARCYPSGVDVDHFARARGGVPHPELAPYRGRPIFAYVGVIDERLDLALLGALAAARPEAVVVLVGPVVKIDPATLPRRDNIVYLGQRGYDELPAILAGVDVALMPFARNAHTRHLSPTKTLEYLAAGLPVVSTAVPDVVAEHADVVAIASDADDFLARIEAAVHPDPSRTARADAKVRAAGWDGIVAGMRADLERAGIALRGGAPTLRR